MPASSLGSASLPPPRPPPQATCLKPVWRAPLSPPLPPAPPQATCKKTVEQVALKVYHMENLCELNHYQVYREVRVHSSLQHQNIIHLFAAFQVRGP